MMIVAFAIVSVIAVLLLVALILVVRQSKLKLKQMNDDRCATETTLQQSNSRFQRLAANIPGVIYQYVTHADGSDTFIYISDRAQEIYEYPADVLLQDFSAVWRAIHPDDVERVRAVNRDSAERLQPFDIEFRLVPPSGKLKWVQAISLPQKQADGDIFWDGIVLDITERKLAQLKDRFFEEQTRLATEAADLGMWFWNIPANELVWTDRCKALFGIAPIEQMTYERFLEALHPEDRDRTDAAVSLALEQKTDYNTEYRTVWSDGSVRWIAARGRGFYDANGQPVRMLGTAQDISEAKRRDAEREQAQAQLQERSEHIQLLYETTRDLLSTDRPLTLINTLFAKLKPLIGIDVYFNYLLDEDKQILRLMFHGGISEETARAIERLEVGRAVCGAVAQQRCQIMQFDMQQSSDPKTELVRSLGINAYSCQPLMAQGKLFGTLGFGSRSRTTFTTAETKLFQALCDQIAIALERANLVSSLQQQTEDLSQLNRLKDEFLAALSHELRTPLNPILGWITLMRSQRLTPVKTTEALEIIERNTRQQIALVENLLDVSSAIQGKLNLKFQAVDLALTLNAAIDTVGIASQAKGIAIESQGLVSLQPIGDRDRLQQVFWNLLSNAIKFTPAGGKIQVELSSITDENANDYAQICVTDNGIGIAAEFLPHVFERFQQADGTTTRKYGGLGLGLAIVQHLVDLHGGTVTAKSPGIGQGATFTVKLPVRPIEASNSDRAVQTKLHKNPKSWVDGSFPPQASSLSTEPTHTKRLRIILVDDEPDNLDLLGFLLQENGAIVTAVTSPLEALKLIRDNPPDVIISDIGMPEMNGYELIRQVRALPQGDRIPALALTAFARHEDRLEALTAGFQAYIAKPIDPFELLSSLAKLTLE